MKVTDSISYGKVPKVFSGNKEEIQFHIHDFANLKTERGELIQTDKAKAHGHLWMLQIFPRGTTDSDIGDVSIYLLYEGKNYNRDPVVAKAMIRTKTSYWYREIESTSYRYCSGDLKRSDAIKNDCNDDGTLIITVELEIATEKNPVWFPRLLTHGDNNNIGAQLYRSIDTTADVTFLVGTSTSRKEFKVHKCILELRAKSLYELILTEGESNSNNEDGNDGTIITLPDTEEKVFDVFLVFLYTGKEPELNKDDEDIAKSILHAANRYGCTDLKLYIESVLVEKFLVPSNAIALLLLADSYSCALLKEAAMNIYINDTKAVIESKEDWTRLKESTDLLVELLLYVTSGRKKYSPVGSGSGSVSVIDNDSDSDNVENGDGDTLEDVDDFDVTSLRERLEKANLDVDGSRQMLVERWKTFLRPTNDDNENQNKRQRIE